MRIDKYGDTLWTRKYNIHQSFVADIASINDSTFILANGFKFPNESTINNGVINLNGDTLLHRSYSNEMIYNETRVHKTSDNGFIINANLSGFWSLIKLDSNYNVQWHNQSYLDQSSNIVEDIDGGYVVIGNWPSSITKYGIVRLANAGDTIWRSFLGNAGPLYSTDSWFANDICIMPDSNYLVSTDGLDWQLMKVNRNTGDTIWTKNYPDSVFGFF